MFFHANMKKFNNHIISLDLWSLSDYASLLVYIIIEKETIQDRKQAIVKNSKKEKEFVNELRNRISCINTINIHDHKMLESVMQEFAFITEELWYKYFKNVNITKCSKTWWNEKYNRDLAEYWTSRRRQTGLNTRSW